MASLRKRVGSNYWVCCFTLPDGQRIQRSTKLEDRSKAMTVCLKWEDASKKARQGNLVEAQARKIVSDISESAGLGAIEFVTTQDFLNKWIKSKEVTKATGTAKRYQHTVKTFLAFLGKRATASLSLVRPEEIEAFRDQQIQEGKSPATANMVVKTLRIPFNLARRQGLITTNPAEAVEMLPAESGIRDTFNREQIKAMLKVADNEWKGMILLGAFHGLRIGDAASLTWANIDMERHSLRFYPQKTAKGAKRIEEEYPLHPDVLEYLESLPVGSNKPKEPLFPLLLKKKVGGKTGLSLTFREIMRKAGIVAEGEGEKRKQGKGRRFLELGYHSLRHTAISEQANIGISKEVRMKLSGHKSNVHERYTHHQLETLRKEIEKVPSLLD